jgi:hypothetical protein
MHGHPTMMSARARASSMVLIAVLAAGCGSAAPSARPSATASLAASATTSGAPSASTNPSATGPTAYAAWIERQGFGGSSGLNNVVKLIRLVAERPGDETTFEIDDEATDIQSLVTWLDAHPPTACWADYHAAVRASLVKVLAAYAVGRTVVDGGAPFPADAARSMVEEADRVLGVPGPTNCP